MICQGRFRCKLFTTHSTTNIIFRSGQGVFTTWYLDFNIVKYFEVTFPGSDTCQNLATELTLYVVVCTLVFFELFSGGTNFHTEFAQVYDVWTFAVLSLHSRLTTTTTTPLHFLYSNDLFGFLVSRFTCSGQLSRPLREIGQTETHLLREHRHSLARLTGPSHF